MSHGYWRVIAAIGCLALASPALSKDEREGRAQTQQPASEQPSPATPTPSENLPPDQGQAYEPECEHPESREDASFCIERRAALAAEQANVLADKVFWPTVLGAIASASGLIFAGWAAVAASIAAKAARASVEHARTDAIAQAKRFAHQAEATERTLRLETTPLLYVACADAERIRWRGKQFNVNPVNFKVINTGKGPAVVTAIYRRWAVCPDEYAFPDPIEPTIDNSDDAFRKNFYLPIAAGGASEPIEAYTHKLTNNGTLTRLIREGSFIYFYGYIVYKDIGGREYVTGFLHVYRMNLPVRGIHLAPPKKNGEKYNYQRELEPRPKADGPL